jgi:hypothetical protein
MGNRCINCCLQTKKKRRKAEVYVIPDPVAECPAYGITPRDTGVNNSELASVEAESSSDEFLSDQEQ